MILIWLRFTATELEVLFTKPVENSMAASCSVYFEVVSVLGDQPHCQFNTAGDVLTVALGDGATVVPGMLKLNLY